MSIRLYAATCGWLTMPYNFFLQGEQGFIALPVPCYLIDHPKGTALFDTGLESALQTGDEEQRKKALGIVESFAKHEFLPGENIAERLIAFGYDPDKIDFIINSHLHVDHCGGNELIKNARLVVQKREWEAAHRDESIEANGFLPHQYQHGHDRMEIDGEHDLFGDGRVVLLPTYGHTPGHQSLKIRLDDGDIVLSADACYMKKSLEKMILPDPMVVGDAEQMLESFRRIQRLQDAGALIIFGHDPFQWKRLNSGPFSEITRDVLEKSAQGESYTSEAVQ